MKLESKITNNQSSLIDNQLKRRSTPVENVRQITPFYAKQTQFYLFFARKRRFHEKTNPIQTQFNPKQSQFKPKRTQFKPNFIKSLSLLSASQRFAVDKLTRKHRSMKIKKLTTCRMVANLRFEELNSGFVVSKFGQ